MSDVAVLPAEADAFGKVETHGIDAIPAAERRADDSGSLAKFGARVLTVAGSHRVEQ